MKTKKLVVCMSIVLSAVLLLLIRLSTSLSIASWGQSEIDFPFELNENRLPDPPTWGATVILSPQYYNRRNLDRLFLWYSKKHPNKEEMLAIVVYTDRDRLKSFLADHNDDVSLLVDSAPRPKRDGAPWDADCWRQGDGLSGGGDNLLYVYAPDLSNRTQTKRVVLRGRDYASKKRITESWETTNNTFKINAIAYDFLNTEPGSKYYTFSSALQGSDELKAFLTIRRDQAIPIPRNQVMLINDQIGYVFMGWLYAVTTDGAKTWHKWDAEAELPDWQCCDPGLIQRVEIGSDGIGSMTLKPNPQRPDVLTLRTKDYGQFWTAR